MTRLRFLARHVWNIRLSVNIRQHWGIGLFFGLYVLVGAAAAVFAYHSVSEVRSTASSGMLDLQNYSNRLRIELHELVAALRAASDDPKQIPRLNLAYQLAVARLDYMGTMATRSNILDPKEKGFPQHVAAIRHAADETMVFFAHPPLPNTPATKAALAQAIDTLASESEYFSGDSDVVFRRALDYKNRILVDYASLAATLAVVVEISIFALLIVLLRLQAQNRALQQITLHDPLTGLLNRRGGLEGCEKVLALARRLNLPVSLAIIDLDNFKVVNDTFGHPVGDAVLQHATMLLQQGRRQSDILARIGGEEFMLVMPATGVEDGLSTCERLRILIANSPAPHFSNSADGPQTGIPFTASFGLVTADPVNTTLDDMYRRADKALYRAKKNGRNQVVMADAG